MTFSVAVGRSNTQQPSGDHMASEKDVLTTGEVAKICNVAPRTVSKWFDSGKLRGYRIPGSKDRRIPREQLIRFMKAHNMPLENIDSGGIALLAVVSDADFGEALALAVERESNYQLQHVRSAFEAGARAQEIGPSAIIVDTEVSGMSGRNAVRAVRNIESLRDCGLIAMAASSDSGAREALLQDGYDDVLVKPFKTTQLLDAVNKVCLAGSSQ